MRERYLLIKECRVEQIADNSNCLELGLTEETQVAVADRRELIELLPILNDYGNNTKSGRHLPKNFIMPIEVSYARRVVRELAEKGCLED